MLNPPINELIEITGSRYCLVIAASMRARQIIDGAEIMIRTTSTKPVSIATDEIYQGKVRIVESEYTEEMKLD